MSANPSDIDIVSSILNACFIFSGIVLFTMTTWFLVSQYKRHGWSRIRNNRFLHILFTMGYSFFIGRVARILVFYDLGHDRRGTLIINFVSTCSINLGCLCHIYALLLRTDAVILTPRTARLLRALVYIATVISAVTIILSIFPIFNTSLVIPTEITRSYFLSGYWDIPTNLQAIWGVVITVTDIIYLNQFNRYMNQSKSVLGRNVLQAPLLISRYGNRATKGVVGLSLCFVMVSTVPLTTGIIWFVLFHILFDIVLWFVIGSWFRLKHELDKLPVNQAEQREHMAQDETGDFQSANLKQFQSSVTTQVAQSAVHQLDDDDNGNPQPAMNASSNTLDDKPRKSSDALKPMD